MQKSKFLTGLGILAAIVVVGLGIGWLATRGDIPKMPPPALPEPGKGITSTPPPPIHHERPTHVPSVIPNNVAPAPVPVPETTAFIPTNTVITNWEDRVDDILAADSEDTNKVQQLFAMFPQLPPEGKEEVSEHLSNLVEDQDYAPLGNLLTDASQPEDVLDVLLSDLLNRPDSTKLPLFLELAKNPNHPKAEEAKEMLELYVDEDYGNDWSKWDAAIQKYLKENPEDSEVE